MGMRYQCNIKPKACRSARKQTFGEKHIDSPVIYGVRVETSNPYHLLYIEMQYSIDMIMLTKSAEKVKCFFCRF